MPQPAPAFAVVVDTRIEEPVYVQIGRQLREAIARGLLASAAPLPSVRALASDLGVNLNTIARAYRLLEEEGFIEIESRSGARVLAAGARGTAAQRQLLVEELRTVFWRMRQAGFGKRELHRLAVRQVASLGEPPRS